MYVRKKKFHVSCTWYKSLVLPRVFDISVALSINGFLHTFCGVVWARSGPLFSCYLHSNRKALEIIGLSRFHLSHWRRTFYSYYFFLGEFFSAGAELPLLPQTTYLFSFSHKEMYSGKAKLYYPFQSDSANF